METDPAPPSRTYQRLILVAVVLCGLSLVLMGTQKVRKEQDYQPALWSCSTISAVPR